ncbi:MAG: anti-sigma factor [Proteobacteria bacterium]|nr:anti-sigma factor [Pseudomonadota bacterium]
MSEMDDDILEILTGALDPEAQRQREQSVESTAEGSAALDAARETVAQILSSLPPEAPSASVRQRLMRELGGPSIDPATPAPAVRSRSPLGWIAAAALAASAATAVLMWSFESRETEWQAQALAEARAQGAELALERDELRELVAESDAELVEFDERLNALEVALLDAEKQIAMLRSPDVEIAKLRGRAGDPAHARVFWEWDQYYCYLHARELGSLAEGQTYALWVQGGDAEIVLAGAFAPAAGGEATLWTQLPRDMGRVVKVWITIESAPAGPAPTGAVALEAL